MIISGALDRGLTLSDFKMMTVGGIIDYIITYNNLHFSSEDSKNLGSSKDSNNAVIRRATQEDWDQFSV